MDNIDVEVRWDCEIEGIPPEFQGEVRLQAQRQISEDAAGWDAGEHRFEFDLDLDDDPYTITVAVLYATDPEPLAQVQQCEGELAAGSHKRSRRRGHHATSRALQIDWDTTVEGVDYEYVEQITLQVDAQIRQLVNTWDGGEERFQFRIQLNDNEFEVTTVVDYNKPEATVTITWCHGEVTRLLDIPAFEVDGAPEGFQDEAQNAVRNHIVTATIDWEPGDHFIGFPWVFNEIPYMISGTVEYSNNGTWEALVTVCRAERRSAFGERWTSA